MKPVWNLVVGLLLLAGTPVLPLPGGTWTVPTTPSTPSPAPVSPSDVTAVVYVYEKDDGPVPPGVAAGLDRLNRDRKIQATLFEDDTVDGTGQTPEQYKPAVDAARKATLPALVVMAGKVASKVVKAPKTADDVLGAVR